VDELIRAMSGAVTEINKGFDLNESGERQRGVYL